jgi:hypothetical protein
MEGIMGGICKFKKEADITDKDLAIQQVKQLL